MPENTTRSLSEDWLSSPRWQGIRREYTAEDVHKLRPQVLVEHTLARVGAERLWRLLDERDDVPALGALTGGQAVQMVKAGLEAIYLSGWQVAADANLAEQVYPDQSLYPANSVPTVIRRINNALRRADQIAWAEGEDALLPGWPIVADAEAGFGGAAERLRADGGDDRGRARPGCTSRTSWPPRRSAATWAARCWSRPASSSAPCTAARLAADVAGVPTLLVAAPTRWPRPC